MKVDYKVLLRQPYEMYASAGWGTSALWMTGMGLFSKVPSTAFVTMAAVSTAMCFYRGYQTSQIVKYIVNLSGKAFSVIDGKEVVLYCKKNEETHWLGFGFEWQPSHSQIAYDLLDEDKDDIYPSNFLLKLYGIKHNPSELKGSAWIHGLEPNEIIINLPLSFMSGHCAIFGTTGAGKTSLYENLILQMATRGDAIFLIDPKGDRNIRDLCQRVMQFIGRPEYFIQFNPAFPATSIRLDPLRNFNRGTETASRISSLTASESGKDTFAAVTWDAVNAIGAGERYLGIRPQLETTLKKLSSGVDKLLGRVIEKYLNDKSPGWQSQIGELLRATSKDKYKSKIEGASPELNAHVAYYKKEIEGLYRDNNTKVLESLLKVAEYPRDWHSKMVANVIPLLTMLSSEELGRMLSPDYDDINDKRPIFDTQKIIDGRYLCYIGLDSLPDQEVGSAIASIILSDLASVAGFIYNYTEETDRTKTQIIIDEASEVANQPLIQLLNKSRGAGFEITLASQTYSDYVVRMGDDDKARMLLGNCNNMVVLRIIDGKTQDYIIDKLGETSIKQTSKSHGSGNRTEDHGLQFSGNITESISKQKVPLLPKAVLVKLPDLHYFAVFGGDKLYKGRFPKVSMKAQ